MLHPQIICFNCFSNGKISSCQCRTCSCWRSCWFSSCKALTGCASSWQIVWVLSLSILYTKNISNYISNPQPLPALLPKICIIALLHSEVDEFFVPCSIQFEGNYTEGCPQRFDVREARGKTILLCQWHLCPILTWKGSEKSVIYDGHIVTQLRITAPRGVIGVEATFLFLWLFLIC